MVLRRLRGFPVIFCMVLMFHKRDIVSDMQWVGLTNFPRLFQDKLFFKAILNTLTFLLVHIPLQLLIALFLAELLNQKIRMRGFFRASFFLPVVVSGVVITILWDQQFRWLSVSRLLCKVFSKRT